MSEYTENLKQYLKKDKQGHRSSKRIFNATKEHAKELINNILKIAAEDRLPIKMVSGELNTGVYDSQQEALEEVLKRKLPVEVIVLDPNADIDNNKFAQIVVESEYGTISKGKNDQLKDFPHFILAGTDCLRVETDHGQTRAEAFFYNPPLGNNLQQIFELLKKSGQVANI